VANVFSPNLDGENIDASGRREDGCHRTAQKVRSSSAVFLTLGGWCGTAIRGGHFYKKRGVIRLFCQSEVASEKGDGKPLNTEKVASRPRVTPGV
jgi:hypothetical protein